MTATAAWPTPLDDACRTVRTAFAERAAGAPPTVEPPVVVPLGAADPQRPDRDPHLSRRAAATVHLSADAVLVGPWGGTEDSAGCGHCLAIRWQRLRSRSERDAVETGTGMRPAGDWPLLPAWVLDAVWALWEATVRAPRPPASPARTDADRRLPQVSRLDLSTLQVQTFPMLAEPLCPSCAEPGRDTSEGAALRLTSRTKPGPDTYHERPASGYPLPAAALANPVCGALGGGTWINVTSPTTSPVAGSVFVRGYAGLTDVTWSGQSHSFDASRTLAFLEGLERYAGTHRRRRDTLLTDSYANVAADALDPADCGFYAPRTYREDPRVDPFSADRPIPWVWGYSLRDERPILVPARLVHYSAGLRSDNFVFETSNGCAIGGSIEEAALSGLLELIERDAFLLAWYGNAPLTEIDLDSCRDTTIRGMVDRAALQGYEVHAFDNRVDLAVPVVTGLAVRRDGKPGTLSFGAGAALGPEAAVEAALSEVLTYIPHLGRQVEERRDELEAMADDFDRVLHLKDHAQLYGLPRMAEHARTYLEPAGVRPLDDLYREWHRRKPRTTDLLDDLLFCRDELAAAGLDVIVVDQTTPEQRAMGLCTVATLAPGLLPIDFGWSRQRAPYMPRLRTAFRRAGLRSEDLAEDEIRLVPHPFP